jgi:hypothetical protein
VNARAFAPAYAALNRRFASDGLPSGSRDAALRSLDAEKARSYDGTITNNLLANENAKSEAARLLTNQQQIANPFQWYGGASTGYNSIMQAPLQSAGIGGILGGVAGSLGSSAITAFCPIEGSMILMFSESVPRQTIETLKAGDEVLGRDGEPDTVIDEPESRMEDCVLVLAANGSWSRCSKNHALMHMSGGFVRASESLGQKILTESYPSVVTSVQSIGLQKVYQLRLKRAHAYCADGLWALE